MTDDRTDLPWFPFHIGDFLRVMRGWRAAACGAYVELLCAQWDRGSLPINADELRALIPRLTDAEWAACWPMIENAFPSDGDSRRNAAFARMRDKQMRARLSRRSVAQKAAAERWRDRTGIDPNDASSTPKDA